MARSGERPDKTVSRSLVACLIAVHCPMLILRDSRARVCVQSLPVDSGDESTQRRNIASPVIKHGDIVVCKSVELLNDIRDNEIYAVRSNGNVWVKYVQKVFNNRGRITRFKLISANYFDNDPFEEEVNETTRLYKVVRKISNV